jgi:hypothetical protein
LAGKTPQFCIQKGMDKPYNNIDEQRKDCVHFAQGARSRLFLPKSPLRRKAKERRDVETGRIDIILRGSLLHDPRHKIPLLSL